MSYPPIYIINLKRTPERKLYIQRQLDAFNLKYRFVEAVDKYDLKSKKYRTEITEQLDIDKTHMESLYSHGKIGSLACILSHIKVYNLIIQNNIPYACVLEDDVHLLPVFPKILVAAPKVPWDILLFTSLTYSVRHIISELYPFRFRIFYQLMCYKRYYPQLNPFTARLLTLKILKFLLFRLQNKILKIILQKPKHITHHKLWDATIWFMALKIGAIPNNDKLSWHKVVDKHYIATPHDEISNITSAMAYMLTRSAAIKWKKRVIPLNGASFLPIDAVPIILHREKLLNLRIIHPSCVWASYRYLINSANC